MNAERKAVSLSIAAKELGKSLSTVRRWIRDEGAPTEQLGEVGRGKGTLVSVDALRRWQAKISPSNTSGPTFTHDDIAKGIENAFNRAPEGYAQPAWAELGMSRFQAAALLFEVYREIVRSTEGKYPETPPAEMFRIQNIFLSLTSKRPSPGRTGGPGRQCN